MFILMVDMWVNDGYTDADYITAEWSGIRHNTREEAEEELEVLMLHEVDNEALRHAYIEEV